MGLTNWATFAEQAKMSTRGQWKLLSKLLRSNDPPDTTLAQVMTRRQHTTITCEQQWDSNLGGPIGQCPDPTSLNLTKRELSPPTTSPHVTMQTRATYRIRLNRFAYSAYLLVMTQDKVVSGGVIRPRELTQQFHYPCVDFFAQMANGAQLVRKCWCKYVLRFDSPGWLKPIQIKGRFLHPGWGRVGGSMLNRQNLFSTSSNGPLLHT